jgi:DNA-binding MarR family transcriptional regulator
VNAARFVCACAAARHVARTLTQLYDTALRDTGLEAPQFALLMAIDQIGPCNQSALGERYALDKTTVSRNLKWLERQGWVQVSIGRNRRERKLTLTAEGRTRLAAAHPKWRKAQALLRSEMSDADWNAMFRAFGKITEAAHRAKDRRRRGFAN